MSIAYRAIQNGYDACFTTAAELIDELSGAAGQGQLRKALAPYLQAHVLVTHLSLNLGPRHEGCY